MKKNKIENVNEVNMLAALSNGECSYLVRYYYSWVEDDRLYMVMECAETNLMSVLQQRRARGVAFSEQEVVRVAVDVLRALGELHGKHYVHMDVKPGNILHTSSGKFKLADFGHCRAATLAYKEDINEGDSKYIPREILNNYNVDRIPDLRKADIFSLGMTLFELITL